jgi:hypothetical protein
MHGIAHNLLLDGYVQPAIQYISQYHELTTYSTSLHLKSSRLLKAIDARRAGTRQSASTGEKKL